MNNTLHIQPCLLEGEEDLPEDTPLYKYLPIESFLYLYEFNRINFTRITSWPDAYEGARYEFLKKAKKDKQFSEKGKNDFFGSCWSLQTEEICLYDRSEDHEMALEELKKNGSASMWDSYCRNGGVRIKTTLGKLNKIIANGINDAQAYRGKVYYEPVNSWNKTIKTYDVVSALFMKPISFRHEAEYRYIIVPNSPIEESIIPLKTGNLYDFIDEILVAPAIPSKKWVSRTIYNICVGISCHPDCHGINHKNGNQFCRVSPLYGVISGTVGYYDMG